ncbi:hypothetical protein OAJ93_02085 [Gammaproteobacteria bacterium]|nr:hypothetical protein [Gammaproteobacteria bacterium]
MIDEGIEHYETSDNFTASEKIALKFSDLMDTDPDKIDEAFYNQLKTHYSVEAIVELGAFIGFNIGFHTWFGTLGFYPMFTPDGRLVDQEESARIYGDKPISHTQGAMQRANEGFEERKTDPLQ